MAGALFAVLGSGLRAWFSLVEYRDLMERLQLGKVATEVLTAITSPLSILFKLPNLIRLQLEVGRRMDEIRREGGQQAQRLTDLSNQYLAWTLVLLGAVLALAASVIRAVYSP